MKERRKLKNFIFPIFHRELNRREKEPKQQPSQSAKEQVSSFLCVDSHSAWKWCILKVSQMRTRRYLVCPTNFHALLSARFVSSRYYVDDEDERLSRESFKILHSAVNDEWAERKSWFMNFTRWLGHMKILHNRWNLLYFLTLSAHRHERAVRWHA